MPRQFPGTEAVELTLESYYAAWRDQAARYIGVAFRLNPDDLDDVMSLVDEKIWRALERGLFRQGSDERRWVLVVACNAARDWLRAERCRGWRLVELTDAWADALVATGPGPEQAALDAEWFVARLALLDRLTPGSRAALLLAVSNHRAGAENAAALGLTYAAYHNRLKWARRRLGQLARSADHRAA